MISLPFSENLLTIIIDRLFNVTYTAILRTFQLATVLVYLTDVQYHYETMCKKLFDWVYVIDFASNNVRFRHDHQEIRIMQVKQKHKLEMTVEKQAWTNL